MFSQFYFALRGNSSALENAATLASFGLDVRVSETFAPRHLFAGLVRSIKM